MKNKKLEVTAAFFFIIFLSLNILFNPRNVSTNFVFMFAIALLLIYVRKLVHVRNTLLKSLYIVCWLYLLTLAAYFVFVTI